MTYYDHIEQIKCCKYDPNKPDSEKCAEMGNCVKGMLCPRFGKEII